MLGLSVGWETWGVLGLPLVLLLPDLRRMLVAGATALAAAAAAYLPFVLVGPFRMGSYAWLVAPQSFVHALLGVHSFSWRDRLLQAVVVGVVALVAIAIARWRSAAPAVTATVVVAVTVFAKVLMDPQTRNYYWLPIQVLLLTGIAALWRREPRAAVAAAPALAVAVIAPLQTWPVELVALVALVAGIGLAPGRLVRPDPLRPPLLPDAEPALTG
jgi:hypothetical protein